MKTIPYITIILCFICQITLGSSFNVVSTQSETIKRSSEGLVTEMIVESTSKVVHNETITETWNPSESGQLQLISRKTVTVDTLNNKTTTIEGLVGGSLYLKVLSRTTLINGENGSSITTIEVLQGSEMTVTKRTVVARNNEGHLVTTEESLNTNGVMTVTKQSIVKH